MNIEAQYSYLEISEYGPKICPGCLNILFNEGYFQKCIIIGSLQKISRNLLTKYIPYWVCNVIIVVLIYVLDIMNKLPLSMSITTILISKHWHNNNLDLNTLLPAKLMSKIFNSMSKINIMTFTKIKKKITEEM